MTLTIAGRPISKKNSRRIGKSYGRTFNLPSVAFVSFEKDALYQLKKIKEHFTGQIRIDYRFYIKGQHIIDVDNAMAGINDILQKAQIIDNDKNIIEGTFKKIMGSADFYTEITINPLSVL